MAAGGNWKEMFHASENGDLELVRYHLRMGVDPNHQHQEYMTCPLLESVRKGHLEIVELLLQNGAKPNIIKDFGTETPMSIAIEKGNKAAIYLLNTYLPEELRQHQYGTQNKILITGGNRGIGKAVAKNLLIEGQKVIITVRNEAEGNTVVEELKTTTGNPNISLIQGDLSNTQSCKKLIQKIKEDHSDINRLINNAGIWMAEKQLNEDGLEKSFMVNYLAPYLLCQGLFPILKQNKPSRIVNVNAGLYVKGKLDIEKTPYGLDFGSIKTYANTKLCNVMFTIDFAKKIEGSGVTINAVHPGVINTGLGDSPKLLSKIVKVIKRFWKSPEYGAEAPSWLAISEEVEGVNGKFYNEKSIMDYIDVVVNEELRAKLLGKTKVILTKKGYVKL